MLSVYGLAAMMAVAGLLFAFGMLTRGDRPPDRFQPTEQDRTSTIGDEAQDWLRGRHQI